MNVLNIGRLSFRNMLNVKSSRQFLSTNHVKSPSTYHNMNRQLSLLSNSASKVVSQEQTNMQVPSATLQRIVPIVERNKWVSSVVYNPTKSVIDQIIENNDSDKKWDNGNRFTKLLIDKYVFDIHSTEVTPYVNSHYIVYVFIKDNFTTKQTSFNHFGINEECALQIEGVQDLDVFFKYAYKYINE